MRRGLDGQQLGHHVDGAIVLGGSQAPGDQDDVDLLLQPEQGGADGPGIVGDHQVLAHREARLGEARREEPGVPVGHLAGQHFVADGEEGSGIDARGTARRRRRWS